MLDKYGDINMNNLIKDTIRKYNPIKSVQAELLVQGKRIPVSVTRWARGQLVLKPDMDSVFEQDNEPVSEIAQTPESSATPGTQTTLTTDDVAGGVQESTEPTEPAPKVTDNESTTQNNNHNQDEASPGERD